MSATLVNGEYQVPVSTFETKQYLCTCGLSAKKPFCDGEHNRQNTPFKPLQITINDGNVSFLAIREKVLEQEAANKKAVESKHYCGVFTFALLTVSIMAIKQVFN
ncbi:hypothetical protein FDP41_003452 [Naegleria fowleri]|uniref:Iron-binding zinc finger CDGSH type domain-containing protein n=1 Tax=Naegleria fowleri TaxID=5763 RepID=A0A6A5BUN7_NAEFO|nr:uncharacterized protein FDP41_003452 [Naegleria fowleri]KAF0977460.1 hypothetical protein FDP41_003452 [Naegleria fowleri]CAG4711247.1 unnamed protein product [Naegleria fowleri]